MLCVLCKIGCNGRATVAIRSGENPDVRVKRGRTLATRVKQGVACSNSGKNGAGMIQRAERCITAGGSIRRATRGVISATMWSKIAVRLVHISIGGLQLFAGMHRPTLGVSSFAVEPVSVVNDRITY